MMAILSAWIVAFVAAVVATPPPSKMATPPRVAAGGKVSLAKARGVICALMFVVAFGAVVVAPVAHAAKNYDFLCLSYDDFYDARQLAWSAYPERKQKKEELEADYSLSHEERRKKIDDITPAEVKSLLDIGQRGLFIRLVNNKLAEGWSAQGGISVHTYEQSVAGFRSLHTDYCQAFIK